MSLREFFTSTTKHYLLGIHDSESFCPVQQHSRDPEGVSPPLQHDIPSNIDLVTWFGRLIGDRVDNNTYSWDHQQFFASKMYCFTDFHYDSYYNVYVCCTGTRRWTLAPPEASSFFQSTNGTYSNKSGIVPHLNDFRSSPSAREFPFVQVDLNPGDVLFVPSFMRIRSGGHL